MGEPSGGVIKKKSEEQSERRGLMERSEVTENWY